jgi:hypothetical protein
MGAVVRWSILGLFGLLFAYDVWEAIGNFIGIYTQGLPFGLLLTVGGWVFLLLAVFAPIVLFVLAAILTRKRTVPVSLAMFVIALMVSAVISLDITLAVPLTVLLG